MHIAILGATSQIASDLIPRLAAHNHTLWLYARRPESVTEFKASPFSAFGETGYDAIINCVGVGDPAKAAQMGTAIFEATRTYDQLALAYVKTHLHCRYIHLSSGAVYGGNFTTPTSPETPLEPASDYGKAKLEAEMRHRALAALPIVDIRVFNYFSRTQDPSARFFITDMLRALKEGRPFKTSADTMMRDYLHPDDFFQLMQAILQSPPMNAALDAYTLAPIDKFALLNAIKAQFGLSYEITTGDSAGVNATGAKVNYYSTQRRAAELGYVPRYSSLDGVMQEVSALLGKSQGFSAQ